MDETAEDAPAILDELELWLLEHEYQSLAQMQGCMSQRAVAEPAAFQRVNYIKVLGSFGRQTV